MTSTLQNCQFQGSRYTVYTRGTDGSYESTENCDVPNGAKPGTSIGVGLMNTEENRIITKYQEDDRRYQESIQHPHSYYNEYGDGCIDGLGKGEDSIITECAETPALEHPQGAGFAAMLPMYWKEKNKGSAYTFNEQYDPSTNAYGGRAKAAFARIHSKEGNEDTGYLKIRNPPNLFGDGGKLTEKLRRTNEAVGFRGRLTITHDEQACAAGISQFCQVTDERDEKTKRRMTFKRDFYTAGGSSPYNTISSLGLGIANTPGTNDPEEARNVGFEAAIDEEAYNAARGFQGEEE